MKATTMLGAILLWMGILLLGSTSFAQTSQTFTTTGSFTPPPGVTSIKVECWGGGGAGGGATGNTSAGGGGGGGSYVRNDAIAVTPGTSYTVTVGAGAVGSTTAGAAGGDSWFNSNTTILAKGGNGGALASTNNSTAAGASARTTGNLGSTSPFSYYGGGGGTGGASGASGGGGGSSAGTGSNGNNASGINAGTAVTGGGAGVAGSTTSGDGADNANLGGGGAGATAGNNTDRNGGNGGNGKVIITYTCPTYSLTSVSATSVCLPGTSTITLSANASGLPVGTYNVTYNVTGSNAVSSTTASMTVTTAGSGSFTTSSLSSVGSNTITITQIASTSGSFNCTSAISANNTAAFTSASRPTASVSGSTTACGSVTLTASGGLSYSWNGGSNTSSATNTFTSSGTYVVTVTDANGCTNTSSNTVTVNAAPTSVVASASANVGCGTTTVNLTGSAAGATAGTLAFQGFEASGSTVTYAAVGGAIKNGTSGTGDRPASASFVNGGSGSYWINNGTATITTANITGLSGYSAKKVSLNLAAFSIASTTNGLDATDIVTVAISLNGGTTYSDELSVNGGSTGNSYWSFTSGTGVATVTYDGLNSPTSFAPTGGGARTTDGYELLEINLPDTCSQVRVRITMVTNATSEAWVVDDITLTGTQMRYSWASDPAGFTSNFQNPTGVSVSATTTYTLTATNAAGCTATDTAKVTINPLPSAPTGTAGSRCGTGTVSISATAGAGETIDWYAAASGGAVLAGGTGVTSFTTPSISATTNYFAQARNTTTGCLSATRTSVAATINPIPTISNQSSSSTYGTATTYTITATNAATFSAASLPTGITLNTATGVLTIAADCPVGVYSISVSVSSSAGCNGAAAATVTYTRTAKALTITGATTTNKEYDGNTTASVTGGTLVGIVGSDIVNLTQAGTFANKTVGTNKAITSTCSISGANAGNYTLTQPTLTARNITQKPLTVSGTVASNKVYNGNTTATITGGSLVGVISPDVVNLTQAGTFADKNVGTGKSITTTCSISGADAANYSITQPTGLTADITPAALTVTASNQVKCYGYNFSLGTSAFTSSGLISGDAIASVTLNSDGADLFADPGTYDIIPSAATGASFSAANYNITYVNGTLTVSDIPSFSVDPSTDAQTLCQNATATALSVTASPGSGTISSYQWYLNTAASSFGGTLISGATSATYTPSSAAAGVFYYYCVVTNSYGCSLPSNVSGAITINALPTIVTVTGGGTVCNNTQLNASNGASGTIYYQGSTSNGISTATPSTSELISVTGTYYFRALSAEGCWGPQGSAAVVIQAPIVTGVEICQGAAAGSMSTSFTCNALNNQTSGPNDATVGSNVTGVGTLAWTNPGNIAGAGTAGMTVNANTTTNYLRGTGYGFNIPSTAVINGITVSISRSSNSTSTTTNLRDNEVKLVKAGTIEATNKASSTLWGNLATVNYGGAADLWSSSWTPSDINNANFGVVLSILNTNTGTTARTAAVDFIRVTVTYSIAGSLDWYTVSSGGTSIGSGSSFNPVGVSGSGISNTNTAGTIAYYVECRTNPGCRGSANYVINALPTAPTAGNAARCGIGTVDISATPASGETIDWYAAASGGTALLSSSTSFTTPSISATTVYYAEARNIDKGCVSASRTAVTATVKSATTSSTDISVCDSYSWNGNTYTSSGTYTYLTMNAAGCDSTATLNLTITASTTHSNSASACDSYTWTENGQTYTTSGSYSSVTGCHTEVLNLTITASTSNTTPVSACDSYTWSVNGQTYTASGSYTDVDNCHSEILNLTITASTNNTTTASVCDSYVWSVNGQTYTTSGSYSSVSGCHTEYLNLAITESTTHTNTVTAGGSYTWTENGQTYTSSGTYSAVTGCHTEVLNLTIVPLTSDTTTISACDTYTWSENSQTYTASGTYTSVSGYHTKVLVLTITASSSNTTPVTSCDSYIWSVNGQTYTASGTYTDVDNCHSEILDLTIVASTSNTTTASVCDSYVWSVNSQTYTTSGSYTSVSGCHTEILNLTITASTTHNTTESSCDSFTWVENGQTYTSSGTYSAVTGCHTEILNLTITTSSSNTSTVNACDSYVWAVNGQAYTTSGTYTDVDNCHTEILELMISASTSNTTVETACSQYTWSVNSQTYTTSGVYTSVTGCATEILELTINLPGTLDTTVTACGSYTLNGNTYSASGDYTQQLTAVNGCDSTIQLHLTVNPLPEAAGAVSGVVEVCNLVGSSTPTTYSVVAVAGATSYNWIVPTGVTIVSGQGTNSIGVTFVNTLAATNQKISVFTVNEFGCQSAVSSFITLTKTVPGIPTISGPTNPCPFVGAGYAEYTCDSIPSANSYLWTAPRGSTIVSGQGTRSIQVEFTSSFTLGAIGVTAMSNCGNRAQRTYTLTRLTPGAPVAISGPTSACSFMGNSQQATYSIAPVANAASYTWTVPANVTIVSGQGTTSIVVTFGGNYVTSNFKVKSVSNCFTSSERQLSVTAATYAAPGAISGPTNACFYVNNDATATYTIRKVPNAPDYIWTVPAGVTIVSHPGGTGANDTSIAVTFNSNFVFGTRILVQTTGCGTSSATGLTITGTVVSMPNIISGPTNVCQFMVSPSNPNGNLATYTIRKVSGATYYTWNAPSHATIISHPAGTGINDTIVQVKYADEFVSGTLGVKAGNACGSSTTRSLTISRLNVATPSNIDVQLISDCPSRVYKYALSSMPLQATSVIWTVPEGATIISGQGTTTINVSYPPSAIFGYVTAKGINNCSSGSTRIRQIKIQACPSSFTSTEPTSKGAMVAAEEMTVSVYPNPTTTEFRINLNTSSNEVVKVRVMDMQGRMVKNYTLAASQQMSFGNDLKAGSYMVEFIQGNKKKVQRLMKF